MSGKDAIIEKILEDARAIATATSEEANAKGTEILRLAREDAEAYREKNAEESLQERKEILQRQISVANLEVKKNILAAKQEVIGKAFTEAVSAIRAEKESYQNLIRGMLCNASDGDTVVFSEGDKEWATGAWLADFCKKVGKKIAFGGYGDFCGGVIVTGKGSDKNMTLEVELATIRDEYEPHIASLLFGE